MSVSPNTVTLTSATKYGEAKGLLTAAWPRLAVNADQAGCVTGIGQGGVAEVKAAERAVGGFGESHGVPPGDNDWHHSQLSPPGTLSRSGERER